VKFKIDENLPAESSELLRSIGHDALTIIDQKLVGKSDETILKICDAEERVLLTLDLDFSDIRSYPPGSHFGIIVLRLYRQDKSHVLAVLERITPLFEQEELRHQLWIVDEDRVRIRS